MAQQSEFRVPIRLLFQGYVSVEATGARSALAKARSSVHPGMSYGEILGHVRGVTLIACDFAQRNAVVRHEEKDHGREDQATR